VINVNMRHCRSAQDFVCHVMVHELGHFANAAYNNGYYRPETQQGPSGDPNWNRHYDGCQAEVACFGFSIGTNCQALGYPHRQGDS
jgi:hypothetical protein